MLGGDERPMALSTLDGLMEQVAIRNKVWSWNQAQINVDVDVAELLAKHEIAGSVSIGGDGLITADVPASIHNSYIIPQQDRWAVSAPEGLVTDLNGDACAWAGAPQGQNSTSGSTDYGFGGTVNIAKMQGLAETADGQIDVTLIRYYDDPDNPGTEIQVTEVFRELFEIHLWC